METHLTNSWEFAKGHCSNLAATSQPKPEVGFRPRLKTGEGTPWRLAGGDGRWEVKWFVPWFRSGYFTLSGSSTQMRWSYCSGHVSLYLCSIIRRKWVWGKPLFWNSTTYTRAITLPSICFLNNRLFSSSSLALNTWTTRSGLSCADWSG
jgi:hypothetical protein